MKNNVKKYKSPPVGFALGRTTADNGCGIMADKRTQRNRTRSQKRLNWQKDQGVR